LKNKFGKSKYCIIIALISNIFKPLRNMAATKKPLTPVKATPPKSARIHLTLGEKLQNRVLSYSDKTGLSVPALLRNGLDLLLKQNNF